MAESTSASVQSGQPAFDSELDAIFSKTFAPPPKREIPKPTPVTKPKAAKSHAQEPQDRQQRQSKSRPHQHTQSDKNKVSSKKRKAAAHQAKPADSEPSDIDSEQEEIYAARAAAKRLRQSLGQQAMPSAKGASKAQSQPTTQADSDADSSSADSDASESEVEVEDLEVPVPELSEDDDDESNGEDDQVDEQLSSASMSDMAPSTETAVSHSPEPRPQPSTSSKEQTREQQADRTIFVGNVPLATALERPARKLFTRFLQAQLLALPKPPSDAHTEPSSYKVESLRFRSLPLDVTGSKDKGSAGASAAPLTSTNNHATKRGQQWKAQGYKKRRPGVDAEDVDAAAAASAASGKVFLTTEQKRKVAYITGGQGKAKEGASEAERGGGSCSTYVVLNAPEPVEALVAALDGASFEGRTLRADLASRKKSGASGGSAVDRKEEKRTVFVGGVDVHESEEALRAWVESLLVEAKGPTVEGKWVQRVRMIRDAATGLGKGFAYLLLQDSDCVDELLTLDKSKLKLSKRKLRFERCKTNKLEAMKKAGVAAPASRNAKSDKRRQNKGQKKASPQSQDSTSKRRGSTTTAPVKVLSQAEKKAYGDKLASLSKDDRKAAKSSDADRVARRLQKRERKRDEVKRTKKQEKQGNGMLKALGRKLDRAGGKHKVGGKNRTDKGAKSAKKTS